jgi:hypothetical protein
MAASRMGNRKAGCNSPDFRSGGSETGAHTTHLGWEDFARQQVVCAFGPRVADPRRNEHSAPVDVIYAEGVPCEILLDVDERAVNFAECLRQYGPPPSSQNAPCESVFGFDRRVEMKSRLRSALSPWLGVRCIERVMGCGEG